MPRVLGTDVALALRSCRTFLKVFIGRQANDGGNGGVGEGLKDGVDGWCCGVHGFGIWVAIWYFRLAEITDLMGDRQLLQYLFE